MSGTNNTNQMIKSYLSFCATRKNLDKKTIKSYSIDLNQYIDFISQNNLPWCNKSSIEDYTDQLHNKYKPKSVKRKTASLKAFFHYLEIEEVIENNPFHKIQLHYKEPFLLPKTIPLNDIEAIIKYAYINNSTFPHQNFRKPQKKCGIEEIKIRIKYEICSLSSTPSAVA